MEKTRVKKGEKYWRIWAMDNRFEIRDSIDDYGEISTQMYEMGNYFHTKEEAEAMASKLRAVLKGAEVIEMPSEEEIDNKTALSYPLYYMGNYYEVYKEGWKRSIEWLKSKIVK